MTVQKTISRRRFLKQATLASGAALLAGQTGAAKPTVHTHAGTPRPYRPNRAGVAASFGRSADYGEMTRQRVFKTHLERH